MKVSIERSNQYVAEARIAQGRNVHPTISVDIDPAALSEASRRTIIEYHGAYPDNLYFQMTSNFSSDPYLLVTRENRLELQFSTDPIPFEADVEIDGVTPELVDKLIADMPAYLEKRRAPALAEKEKDRKLLIERQEEQIEKFFASPECMPYYTTQNSVVFASGLESLTSDNPRYQEVRAEIERREQAAKAAKEAQKQAEEAAAQRKQAQLAEWVRANGTPNQKSRMDRGLLPENEAVAAWRAQVFDPLGNYARYDRITLQDVLDSYESAGYDYSYKAESVELQCDSAKLSELTAEQFDQLVAMEAAAPKGAILEPKSHRCALDCSTSEEDETGAVVRNSVLVTVTVGDWTFSREYAL